MNRVLASLYGILIPTIFLAITGAFFIWHLTRLSDGARLEPGETAWTNQGVIVTPLIASPNGLRRGDIVVAVDGRSMEDWTRALYRLESPRPVWTTNQPPVYTIIRDGQRVELTVPLVPYPLSTVLARGWSLFIFILFTQIVGSIVFLVKPADRAPRVLFLVAWSFSHIYPWAMGLTVLDIVDGVGFWLFQLGATGAWLIFWSAILEFAMVLMREHPLFKERPWVRPAIYLFPFLFTAGYTVVMRLVSANYLDWVGSWILGNWLIALAVQIPAVWLIAGEYRAVRDPSARRKIRWLMFGALISLIVGIVFWFAPGVILGHPLIDAGTLGLSLLPFPVVIAIAILRDRLFDIDVIIRRTFVYSIVTASLALIYFSGVIILQQLFRALTGAGGELAIILSTLTIAGLFNPLRHRIQNAIDRRFYRRKYDAQKVLAQFAVTARDETDLDKLTQGLIAVVDETIRPERVSVWLQEATRPLEGRRRE